MSSFLPPPIPLNAIQLYWKDVAKVIPSFLWGLNRSGFTSLWAKEAHSLFLYSGQLESWLHEKLTRGIHNAIHNILSASQRTAAILQVLIYLINFMITSASFLTSLAILKEKMKLFFFFWCCFFQMLFLSVKMTYLNYLVYSTTSETIFY